MQYEDRIRQLEADVESLKSQVSLLAGLLEKLSYPLSQNPSDRFEILDPNENWILRAEAVTQSGTDSSSCDIANLVASVFGKDYLRRYKKYSELPENAKLAYKKVQGRFQFCTLLIL